MRRCLGAVMAPLLLLACWGVWRLGGMLIEWLGLQALDLPVRLCLLVLALTAAEAGLTRLPVWSGGGPAADERRPPAQEAGRHPTGSPP